MTDYNTPHSGSAEWWGGSADNLNNTLTRTIDLTGATTASIVSAWTWYNIEKDYDSLYAEVSTDNGASWRRSGTSVDGDSRTWTEKSWDLSAYKGQSIQFRFRVRHGRRPALRGPFLDDIAITTDGTAATDDVETGANGWTAAGFTRHGWHHVGAGAALLPRREPRLQRLRRDAEDRAVQLRLGHRPVPTGWSASRTRTACSSGTPTVSSATTTPPSTPVAARCSRSTPARRRSSSADGVRLGNRRQPFDATFGQEKTDAVTFHRNGVPTTVAPQRAIPTFSDTDPNRYWTADNPWASVQVAGSGTNITVAQTSNRAQDMLLKVRFTK